MKLRRLIAIILMTLANYGMLAHSVMPHHHHEGVVFLNTHTACCDVSHLCNQSSSCCADEIDSDGSQGVRHDNCDLSQLEERDGRSILDGLSTLQIDKNNFAPEACLCILCYACNELTVKLDKATLCKYRSYSTYTENYTSPYVGAVFGLRAPPAQSRI